MKKKHLAVLKEVVFIFFAFSAGSASGANSVASTQDSSAYAKVKSLLTFVSPDTCYSLLDQLVNGFRNRCATDTNWNKNKLCPWLEKRLLSYGCDSVFRVNLTVDNPGNWDAPVVVGVKFGRKANRTLKDFCIIGAHPDNKLLPDTFCTAEKNCRVYGADDNASGSVAVLEACRVLKDVKFENTILFAMLNAEELHKLGSASLAKYFKTQGYTILGGLINIDCIFASRLSAKYDLRISYDSAKPETKKFAASMDSIAKIYNTIDSIAVAGLNGGADEVNFWSNGYMGVWIRSCCSRGAVHEIGDSIYPLGYRPFIYENMAKVTRTCVAPLVHYAVPYYFPRNIEIKSHTKNPFPVKPSKPMQRILQMNLNGSLFRLNGSTVNSTTKFFTITGRAIGNGDQWKNENTTSSKQSCSGILLSIQ
jgi:hypothetical protein